MLCTNPERKWPEDKPKAAVVCEGGYALQESRPREDYFGTGLSTVMGLKLGGEEQEGMVLHVLIVRALAFPHLRTPPGGLTEEDLRLQLSLRGRSPAVAAPQNSHLMPHCFLVLFGRLAWSAFGGLCRNTSEGRAP